MKGRTERRGLHLLTTLWQMAPSFLPQRVAGVRRMRSCGRGYSLLAALAG